MDIIIDTETTGLNNGLILDEVIQIGACDTDGAPLLNTLVKPMKATPSDEVLKITGIDRAALQSAPTLLDIAADLYRLMTDTVWFYNAAFDVRVLMNSYYAAGALMPHFYFDCAMVKYAALYGQPHEKHGVQSQKLTAALEQQGIPLLTAHDALADAQMTAALMQRMQQPEPLVTWGMPYGVELVSIEKRIARNGKPYASFKSAGCLVVNVFGDSPQETMLFESNYPLAGWLARLDEGTAQPLSKPICAVVQPNARGFVDLIEVTSTYSNGNS
jgi:DNA polymerase III epsilon subunit-like protein